MQSTFSRSKQVPDNTHDDDGFTLIEVLVVIVILAILSATVVFALQNMSGRTAQSACRSDFKTVESELEAFKAQLGSYPTSAASSYFLGTTHTPASMAGTGYSMPSPTVNDNFNGVAYLMQTTDTDQSGKGIGPWLRDAPVNSGHYEIVVSYPLTGSGSTKLGQIDVFKSDGSGPVLAVPTHSISDCQNAG